jgi:hypothetical protein
MMASICLGPDEPIPCSIRSIDTDSLRSWKFTASSPVAGLCDVVINFADPDPPGRRSR